MKCEVNTYPALVVDDDIIVRKVVAFALQRVGFLCDEASDGVEAAALLETHLYDLVVTDLRMPFKHGHSLALDILADPARPVLMVHTSVDDPRMTKDLLNRGVDDIVYKPADYHLLAVRARVLVETRRGTRCGPHESHNETDEFIADTLTFPMPTAVNEDNCSDDHALPKSNSRNVGNASHAAIPQLVLLEKLKHLGTVLPLSQAALDVVDLVRAGNHSAEQIAAAVARDPSLAVDVLKLANSSFYNPSGQKIAELERAVMRIGFRRISELAMAATALTALTANVLPWMDVSLAWRRSIAAALAVDALIDDVGLADDHDGLFLSALMHGLGRVALGMMFPDEYESMIAVCRESKRPLLDEEAAVLSESHAETMVRLLDVWNVPTEICEPLKHVLTPFSAMHRLDGCLRKKVTLLKFGVLVGQLAVGEWEFWDLVDLPDDETMASLGLSGVSDAVERTKAGLVQIVHFGGTAASGHAPRVASCRDSRTAVRVPYRNVSPVATDFLPRIMEGLNIFLEEDGQAESDTTQPVLFNCIGSPPHVLTQLLRKESHHAHLVIARSDAPAELLDRATTVVPCSVAALEAACRTALRMRHEASVPSPVCSA